MIKSLLYIADTNFLFFFVFQAIQASLLIDLGQETSQDPSKKGKIIGPSTELKQVPVDTAMRLKRGVNVFPQY